MRDTLTAPAGGFDRTVFRRDADTTLHAALKKTRNHLALVPDGDDVVGVITLSDVLRRLFPAAATATA